MTVNYTRANAVYQRRALRIQKDKPTEPTWQRRQESEKKRAQDNGGDQQPANERRQMPLNAKVFDVSGQRAGHSQQHDWSDQGHEVMCHRPLPDDRIVQ